MDFFYKPPMQREDECAVLEENYVNCLMQKALKDRVMNNKCVLDSILWFHLECPKAAGRFDDPDTFKAKFRDFFAHTKLDAQVLYEQPEHMQKLREEYDVYNSPEDVRLKPTALEYVRNYKQFSPKRVADEEEGDIIEGRFDANPDISERSY